MDWGNQWTEPFLGAIAKLPVQRVLDLGCGTGNDVLRVAKAGYEVVGIDLSEEAIKLANKKASDISNVVFQVADISQRLDFPSDHFDAVMSNVAFHRFSDSVTRSLIEEVKRVLKARGFFFFHVNSTEDRLLGRYKQIKEIEPNYFLEENGQPMRFFNPEYISSLLMGWDKVKMEPIPIADPTTSQVHKIVWRVSAFKN